MWEQLWWPNYIYFVYHLFLSVSASQTLNGDGDFTLKCSLFRYSDLHACEENSIRWLDEMGKVLLDRGVTNAGRTCVSLLTVKHQRGHRKTYTCQFFKENNVKIEAQYTPVFTGRIKNSLILTYSFGLLLQLLNVQNIDVAGHWL